MSHKIIENIGKRVLSRTTGAVVVDPVTGKPVAISTTAVLLELAGDPAFTAGLAYIRAAEYVASFAAHVLGQQECKTTSVPADAYERLLKAIEAPKRNIDTSTLSSYWPFLAGILSAVDEGPESESVAQAAE